MGTEYVDLSRPIEDDMPGFRMREEDGTEVEYSATVAPFRTHDEMSDHYADGCSFEITQVELQTSVGTYIDAPYHRYPDRRDVGDLGIEECINDGVVVDVRGFGPADHVGADVLPTDVPLADRAVLFNFGWDDYWGTERYYAYPSISRELIDRLVEEGVALVGVDTLNVDDHDDPERPAHTEFLADDILVVENLRNLDALHGETFRLHTVPLRVSGAAAMPVRAFAACSPDQS